ncbi:unnamed protein product [Soboliphyme baturini]|uniref:Inorganic diphosphatase n=1 Tax=Soboliphyme baturini TaxID=241478 RepID=A0A183IN14_9BILA|nr:unnamed protein product [Soboliphyme baturini]
MFLRVADFPGKDFQQTDDAHGRDRKHTPLETVVGCVYKKHEMPRNSPAPLTENEKVPHVVLGLTDADQVADAVDGKICKIGGVLPILQA